MGRPPQRPVVWYHDFHYQAASWQRPRRVVAKVEWHCGELFPRVGFVGVFTRLYLSYLDKTGKGHKPILLPPKDPTFYDSLLGMCNTPELVMEPVQVSAGNLASAVHSPDKTEGEMPVVSL